MDDEAISRRSVALVRHGGLVLIDGDTNREIALVQRLAVIEPQDFVVCQLFGSGAGDSVSQEIRIKLLPQVISAWFVGKNDGKDDAGVQVVQIQDC